MELSGPSANLALDQLVAEREAAGQSIVHLGFGESRPPILPALAARLGSGAEQNAYGPVVGRLATREAIAGYFARRNLPTDPTQIITAPGSKLLLLALQIVVPGDVILPRPCWNSYPSHVRLAGKHALPINIPRAYGGVPDPTGLRRALRMARNRGIDPSILILTLPDNPTGTVAPPAVVRALCEIAAQENLLVISDEIYRDVIHDPATAFLSPAEIVPDRTVITTGLSKSLALGGWRVGAARFPDGIYGVQLRNAVSAYASETWSALSAPMQEVAAYAYSEPEEIRAHLTASTQLHGAVARAIYGLALSAGATCRPPTAGFYVYPDFELIRDRLRLNSITDSASLQRYLLEELAIAVLAGHHLGDDPRALRFKASSSMLYGASREQQWAALHAADPVRLPHIADMLSRVEEALMKLGAL